MAYVPIRLPAAPKPRMQRVVIDQFYGVDLTNQAGNVDPRRSPWAPNMVRSVPGKVRKRTGWHTLGRLEGRINGWHQLHGRDPLIHAGTKLYQLPGGTEKGIGTPKLLYSAAADERSSSWEFEGRLFLADGKALLVYDGKTVETAVSAARVPTVTIAKTPAGGGQQYEALNLLQPKFRESFLADGKASLYQLSFDGLDEGPVEVKQLQKDGSWKEKKEGTDYTVNRKLGQITFVSPPAKSPLDGVDNVAVTASRTVEGYADRINRCRIGIPFGVNGAADRLFLSGNPDYRNQDWFSGLNDPTYWGDTDYSVLGQTDSAIVGFSIVSARLAAHKDAPASERNVILREGNLVNGRPSFPICNMLQGEGATAPYSFGYLENEPIFLTRLGLYALTAQDITGEKYAQHRSFYLDGRLLEEQNPEDAFAFVYRDMYLLALNGRVYILDGLQPAGPERSEPYSTRQYAGFLCTDIPARVIWREGEALYFGSPGGEVRTFWRDTGALASYSDDGRPIEASWQTPDLDGGSFYHAKTFTRIGLSMASSVCTGVRALARIEGIWEEILVDEASARYFDWEELDWGKWSWSGDTTPATITEPLRIKKVDKVGFRVENRALNEPFGLEAISTEFALTGYMR